MSWRKRGYITSSSNGSVRSTGRRMPWMKGVIASIVMCGSITAAGSASRAVAEVEGPAFVATISPASVSLVGKSTLNVNVTVTQNGDVEHHEAHSLPSQVRFEFLDSQHQWRSQIGKLVAPVKASGGHGYNFNGTYAVQVPNPDTTLTDLKLKLDSFYMKDVNRRSTDRDDRVPATQYSGLLTVAPSPPNFVASISPASTTLFGASKVNVTVTVTQNGDVENNEGHALPSQIRFDFEDAQHHWRSQLGKLVSPVTAQGGVGYHYIGTYAVTVPNPDLTLTDLTLKAESFNMVDTNGRVDEDDHVAQSQFGGLLAVSPAFIASIAPSATSLTGKGIVNVTVTVTQNADLEEGHSLPQQVKFEFFDAKHHWQSLIGKLIAPVSAPGGAGYKYVGTYSVPVPNPDSTSSDIVLKADDFYMLDGNHGSKDDDHVAEAQFQGSLTIAPAPPNFSANIAPTSTNLTGKTAVIVAVTVHQNGDTEEGHSMPSQLRFEFYDAGHHWGSQVGKLVSPVSARGGAGYAYVGYYAVAVPDPDTTLSDVTLKLDAFSMNDWNHGTEGDDHVAESLFANPLVIAPSAQH